MKKDEFQERIKLKKEQNKIKELYCYQDFLNFFRQWNYTISDFITIYPENKTVFYLSHEQFVNFGDDLKIIKEIICDFSPEYHEIELKEYKGK